MATMSAFMRIASRRSALKGLSLVLLAVSVVLSAVAGQACEKHPKGHQGSTDTDSEYSRSR